MHVSGRIDPISDIETIDTELALADLATLERGLDRAAKAAKSGDERMRCAGRRCSSASSRSLNSGRPAACDARCARRSVAICASCIC